MKIRLIALAGVAALALSTPAMAAQGWYLGLGAGWDQQNALKFRSVPTPTNIQTAKSKDGALIVGSVGYGWDSGLRMEFEDSYTSHDFSAPFGGSDSVTSVMVNAIYDMPLGSNWKLSLGGGVGMGTVRMHATTSLPIGTTTTTGDYALGTRRGLEWQAIAGVAN